MNDVQTRLQELKTAIPRATSFTVEGTAADGVQDGSVTFSHKKHGCTFTVQKVYGKNRLEVVGRWPRARDGSIQQPHVPHGHALRLYGNEFGQLQRHVITVALSKTAERIASEIASRFLPVWSKLYEEAASYCAKTNAYLDKKDDIREKVRESFGSAGYVHDWKTAKDSFSVYVRDGASFDGQISGDSIRVDRYYVHRADLAEFAKFVLKQRRT